YWQNDYRAAGHAYREALDIYRRVGDAEGATQAANDLSYALLAQEQPEEALPLIEAGLEAAREADDEILAAQVTGLLGLAKAQQGDYEGALAALQKSREVLETLNPTIRAFAHGRVGTVLRLMGRLDEAEK